MTTVAIAAMFKNEGRYLPEWVAWHRRMGVSRFYLYDNGSTDGAAEALAAEDVEVVPLPGETQQFHAVTLSLEEACEDWLGLLDIDEFVWCPSGRSIPQVLADVDKDVVWMPWLWFGWGPHLTEQHGSVLQTYRLRKPERGAYPLNGKSFVQPMAIPDGYRANCPHAFLSAGETAFDTGLLVNHYSYSRAECYRRRSADRQGVLGGGTLSDFEAANRRATVYDDRLARFAEESWQTR